MKLPHSDNVRIDESKIREYLLCPTHPDGSGKAKFFMRFGFSVESWHELEKALRLHASECAVSSSLASEYGIRYSVDGPLMTPDGRNPAVRSVWMIEEGYQVPRLITAYPI